jgi:hypothetical protein
MIVPAKDQDPVIGQIRPDDDNLFPVGVPLPRRPPALSDHRRSQRRLRQLGKTLPPVGQALPIMEEPGIFITDRTSNLTMFRTGYHGPGQENVVMALLESGRLLQLARLKAERETSPTPLLFSGF